MDGHHRSFDPRISGTRPPMRQGQQRAPYGIPPEMQQQYAQQHPAIHNLPNWQAHDSSIHGTPYQAHPTGYFDPSIPKQSAYQARGNSYDSATGSYSTPYYSSADYANYYNAQNAQNAATASSTGTAAVATGKAPPTKASEKKSVLRAAGGQVWKDESLADWPDNDFRIFAGDLGNDVTDEILEAAFSRYPSFFRARVVRDKRTTKPKGFGFVSLKDPHDGVKALKEMNGQFIGSRPVKLRRSTWKDRVVDSKTVRTMRKDNKIVKLRPGEI